MSFLKEIDSARMPQHVAIIMDGNGRWAKLRNEDRTEGHKEGVAAVRRVIEGATKIGLKYVTLYTFSTENWNRPSEEIDALMSLMVHAIVSETPDLLKNNIRLAAIGDLGRLPQETRKALSDCIEKTAVSTGTTMVLALSYSSRWEMLEAVKNIAKDFSSQELENISEKTISNYLTTNGIPDPDLLIRTGGEKRISNFLLWQLAYTELCFLDTLWPDFNEESFFEAIVYYQGRERRFGKISEQLTEK